MVRHALTVLLLALLAVAVPAVAASGQTTSEPAVAPSDTLPPTEPAATEFTPPVDPAQSEVGDVAPSVSPVPSDEADGGIPGWALAGVVVLLLAAGLGAARMLRRGPAGGAPGGATEDPYDPEV